MTNKIKLQGGQMKLEGHQYQVDILQCNAKRQCSRKGSQMGLALALDTEIPTPSGMKFMGDLKVGDYVFGDNGKPTKIIITSDVMYNHKCFKVKFHGEYEDSSAIADEDHKWVVIDPETKQRVTKTTGELYSDKKVYDFPPVIFPFNQTIIIHDAIEEVTPVESVPVKCIGVDNDSHLYLATRAYIPTHNTESNVLKTLHGQIYGRYPTGVLYLFPSSNEIADFSRGRFNPLIEQNSAIRGQVKNTDAVNIKQVGSSMLYLRGARAGQKIEGSKLSSSKLKSVPVDRIVYDECDEMDQEMVKLARKRIGHSMVGEEFFLSTPTVPNYGIDAIYTASDQRIWMLKCRKCGKETCLELEFPECIGIRSDGHHFRKCIHCGEEIFPSDGRWAISYPERSQDMVGWYISRLNSVYESMDDLMKEYEEPGDKSEFYNSTLGMAYISAENKLNRGDLYKCCELDAMPVKSLGPTAMGIDVGRKLHVVVLGNKTSYIKKVLYVAEVDTFEEVHDICRRFHTACAVIDAYPETRKAREFQERASFEVLLCQYLESRNAPPMFTHDGMVKVGRTEFLDTSHNYVIKSGALIIPRRSTVIDRFIEQMCNVVKVLETNPDTGLATYKYKKVGDDHFRHAFSYALQASDRVGEIRKAYFGRIRNLFDTRANAMTV